MGGSFAAGVACTAYDAIVNSDVLTTLNEREGMREFLLELVMAHIETKHGVALNRGWSWSASRAVVLNPPLLISWYRSPAYTLLKRRKVMGTLQPQVCRVKTKVKELNQKRYGLGFL